MKRRWLVTIVSSLMLAVLLLSGFHFEAAGQTGVFVPDFDIVFVIDQSSTMYNDNDPVNNLNEGWRFVLTDMFIDWLGVDQSGSNHRMGAVMFGSEAQEASGLEFVTDQASRDSLKLSIIGMNYNMGGTNMPTALDAAIDELTQNSRDGASKVIIFLTDGRCELAAGVSSTPQCEDQVRERIPVALEAGVRIYTIAFTEAAFEDSTGSPIYGNILNELAYETGGKPYEAEKSMSALLNTYTQIIKELLNSDVIEITSNTLDPNVPLDLPFEIPEGLHQLMFTIVKEDADVAIAIHRPDGQLVDFTGPGVRYSTSADSESISILSPEAGTWVLTLTGNGKVTVIKIPFPESDLHMDLLSPGAIVPAGKPLDLQAVILNANGERKSLDNMTVEYSVNGGSATSLDLAKIKDNVYSLNLEDTSTMGTYDFRFYAAADAGHVAPLDDTITITVVQAPWFTILAPEVEKIYPFNIDCEVSVQLMLGNSAMQNLISADTYIIRAELQDSEGNSLDTIQLKSDDGGVFSEEITPPGEGEYPLVVSMRYTNENGETFIDENSTTVNFGPPITVTPGVSPTPTPTVTPPPPCAAGADCFPWWLLGLIGGIALLAGAGIYSATEMNKPALIGMLNSGGALFPLEGKKAIFVGSDPKSKIFLAGAGVRPHHLQLRPTGKRKNPQVELTSIDPTAPAIINGIETMIKILENGDTIKIGDQVLEYQGPATIDFGDDGQTFDAGPSGSDNLGF